MKKYVIAFLIILSSCFIKCTNSKTNEVKGTDSLSDDSITEKIPLSDTISRIYKNVLLEEVKHSDSAKIFKCINGLSYSNKVQLLQIGDMEKYNYLSDIDYLNIGFYLKDNKKNNDYESLKYFNLLIDSSKDTLIVFNGYIGAAEPFILLRYKKNDPFFLYGYLVNIEQRKNTINFFSFVKASVGVDCDSLKQNTFISRSNKLTSKLICLYCDSSTVE